MIDSRPQPQGIDFRGQGRLATELSYAEMRAAGTPARVELADVTHELRGALIPIHAAADVSLCRLLATPKIGSEDREIGDYLASLLTV